MINEQAGNEVSKGLADSNSSFNHGVTAIHICISYIQRHILLADTLSKTNPGKSIINPEDGINQRGLDVLFWLPLL
ncbi:hypothetical protein D3C75_941340 [compost metagenome]